MSLRLLLLIIGVCLVVMIYAREVLTRKKAAKRHAEVVFDNESKSSHDNPVLKNDAGDESFQPDEIRLTKPGRDVDSQTDAGLIDFSISARQGSATASDDQIPLVLHDVVEPDDKPVSTSGLEESKKESPAPREDDILMLVIAPADGNSFQGLEILSATKAAGMKFGKMNIFHNFGAQNMDLDKPLFSLANLYEPGEFNLQEMESFSTRGLVIYMCLPTPIEAETALDMMLNTAQQIAAQLDAVVCDCTRQPLMDEALSAMRAKVQHF